MSLAPSYPQFRPQNFNQPLISTAPNPYTNPRPNPYRIAGTQEYARMHPLDPSGNATMSPSIGTGPVARTAPTLSGAGTAWPTGQAPRIGNASDPYYSPHPTAIAPDKYYGGIPRRPVGPYLTGGAPGTNTLGPNSTYNDQNTYVKGLNEQSQADRIAADPLPTINRMGDAKNPITEQIARQMYASTVATYPTLDPDHQDQMFADKMKGYGLDGHGLLQHWRANDPGGQVQTQFQTGTKVMPAVQGTLLSQLGPDRAGGTAAPGTFSASGGVQGPRIGGSPATSTPVMGPMPGYTPLENAPSMIAPVSDADRARVQSTQVSGLRNQAAGDIAYSAPGARQVFDAQNQNIQSAIQQPVAVAEAKGDAIAAGRAAGQSGPERAADAQRLKNEQANKFTPAQYQTLRLQHIKSLMAARPNMAYEDVTKAVDADIGKLDPNATPLTPGPFTDYPPPSTAVSQPPPRSMGAVDGSTANQAVDAAGGDLGQAEQGLQQRGFKMQPGDQTHLGFIYRKGPDGQYHKVGPAPQGQ